MNTVKNNSEKNNIDEIADIIKGICELSEKVAYIIKEYKKNDDNDDEIAVNLGKIYEERNLLVNKLKAIYEAGNFDVGLLKDNPQLNRYINEIIPLEEANIAFLDTKTKEKKNKLNELINNKSLMIYNKKVNLNYENRIL